MVGLYELIRMKKYGFSFVVGCKGFGSGVIKVRGIGF